MQDRAIFLDRDGTLVHPRHYPARPEELILCTGIGPELRALQGAGFRLVVITNQSGIARGYFTEDDLRRMHDHLSGELAREGVHLDGIYHCPHHPEGAIPSLAIRCDCRKPQPGMLLRATAELGLDPQRSWFIGDILDDVEAGNRAGCRTVLVDLGTEAPAVEPIRSPHFVARDTRHALRIVRATEALGPDVELTYRPARWTDRPPPAALVRRFRGLRALVIGDAMLDSYLEGTAVRLCTEGPVPVVRRTAEHRAPGGAANTAANLRALGARVDFLGVVGRDVAGGLLRTALRERGIDDRWLVEDEGASTLHKLRILADDQYVVRFDEGETRRLSELGRERLLAGLEAAFPGCDLVVVSDYGYGVASDELLARLRALRAARPCPLAIDSKEIGRFRDAGATIVTPNYLEARLAAMGGRIGNPPPHHGPIDLAEVERVGRRLLAQIDAECAAITLARDGVLLLDRDGVARHLPATPVPGANDVGAGDSFTAATALALAAGADAVEAARIGVDAAGIAVTKRRTATVTGQELLQRVGLGDGTGEPHALAELAAWLAAQRLAGRTIVFTNGVFDILHAGHVGFLRRARQLGDLLVVGVNSDRSARRLKGESRPINGERDRLALIAALEAVDGAVLFDEDTPSATIRALRPHIHVKGGDYADETLPEAEAVREVGGRVVILPLAGGLSTSGVIDRIVALTAAVPGGDGADRGAGSGAGDD